MFGDEGNIFAIVIRSYGSAIFFLFGDYIISKSGIRISVTGIQAKLFCHTGTKGCFCTIAATFSRIDSDTPQTTFCKLGELLVAGIHVECCDVGPKSAFP